MGSFEPGTTIIFLDKKTKQSPDDSGCNQIGILLKNRKILFVRNRRLIKLSLPDANVSAAYALPFKSAELQARVLEYFEKSKRNLYFFTAGLKALSAKNEAFFSSPFIMPEFKRYDSDEAYENAWNNLLSQLQKADLLCTFNEKSLISRLIASLDKGVWSHSALYIGNGQIIEAITQGVVKRDISAYKNKHIHIGIYRQFNMTPQRAEKVIQRSLSHIGKGYAYSKVIRLGLKIILGLKLDPLKPRDTTPNTILYSGALNLVAHV